MSLTKSVVVVGETTHERNWLKSSGTERKQCIINAFEARRNPTKRIVYNSPAIETKMQNNVEKNDQIRPC